MPISAMFKPKYICPHCYSRFREPRTQNKGSYLVLFGLLLLLLIPGIIYFLWMLTATEKVCPKCRQPGVIALKTPRGKMLEAAATGDAMEKYQHLIAK